MNRIIFLQFETNRRNERSFSETSTLAKHTFVRVKKKLIAFDSLQTKYSRKIRFRFSWHSMYNSSFEYSLLVRGIEHDNTHVWRIEGYDLTFSFNHELYRSRRFDEFHPLGEWKDRCCVRSNFETERETILYPWRIYPSSFDTLVRFRTVVSKLRCFAIFHLERFLFFLFFFFEILNC